MSDTCAYLLCSILLRSKKLHSWGVFDAGAFVQIRLSLSSACNVKPDPGPNDLSRARCALVLRCVSDGGEALLRYTELSSVMPCRVFGFVQAHVVAIP